MIKEACESWLASTRAKITKSHKRNEVPDSDTLTSSKNLFLIADKTKNVYEVRSLSNNLLHNSVTNSHKQKQIVTCKINQYRNKTHSHKS